MLFFFISCSFSYDAYDAFDELKFINTSNYRNETQRRYGETNRIKMKKKKLFVFFSRHFSYAILIRACVFMNKTLLKYERCGILCKILLYFHSVTLFMFSSSNNITRIFFFFIQLYYTVCQEL